MGYGVTKGVHRIEMVDFDGSGNWVDIHAGRSYGAAKAIGNAAVKLTLGDKAAGTRNNMDIDLKAQAIALFEQSIVAWSLKFDEGDAEPMPLGRETFEGLDEAAGEWLADEITRYYESRKLQADDRKNSNGRSTAPSALAAPSPKS